MTPVPDRAAVEHRLITMRRSLVQLESLGRIDGPRFERDTTAGLVVERVLALLADLALAVNREVTGASLAAPGASFRAAHAAGLVDADTAAALVPADGPHLLALQLSLDTDPDEAAAVVTNALAGYRDYVAQVTAWLERTTARR